MKIYATFNLCNIYAIFNIYCIYELIKHPTATVNK